MVQQECVENRADPVRAVGRGGWRVSVVVPARNEAANLPTVLAALPPVHEVVLVDGHSVDGTIEVARRCLPGVRIVRQTRRGKGNALACGFAAATGDVIVMIDADGSTDPREIPAFVEALCAGADVAKGSRYVRGGGSDDITPLRSFGNKALTTLVNRLFGTAYTDLCYGYVAFWARMVPAFDLPPVDLPGVERAWGDGFEIETLLTLRAGGNGRVVEVPSVEHCRLHGVSNLNAGRDGLRVLRTVLAERRRSGRVGPSPSPAAPLVEPPTVATVVRPAAYESA